MADNYSFGRPSLGKGKPHGLASPGRGSSVPASSKGGDAPKAARPGRAQSAPKVSSGKGGVARPGGAQQIKG